MNPPGTPESRARKAAEASAAANKVTPMPDMADAAIRKRQADEMKKILSRRGRSYTMKSGRTGDQSATPLRKPVLARG